MKKTILLLAALTAPAWAGDSKSAKAPISQPQESCLYQWFVGAGVGYLTDFEEPMGTLQIGADLPRNLGGWCMAAYLEVGYTSKDEDFDLLRQVAGEEMDVIPVTLNLKFERPLTGNLNAYVGAGVGVAFYDYSANFGPFGVSDDGAEFTAQIFAGLVYNVNPDFEIYGGLRWIYADITPSAFPLPPTGEMDYKSNGFIEIGLRYNF